MNDIEWEEFIQELNKKGRTINLKKECKNRGVGLNTLYRKVNQLNIRGDKKGKEIAKTFLKIHPYKPRDVVGIDFEQLMRQSIIEGTSQKGLEDQYGISKRTIQRKFAEIKQQNEELYDIYETYVKVSNKGEQLDYALIEKVAEEYKRQKPMTRRDILKTRRQTFLETLQNLQKREKSEGNTNLMNHYKKEIQRIDGQIESEEGKGEEK